MKKPLSLLLCGLLLLGCSKEYDDSEIKKRLDNLESTRIPSIESQIAAIQTSLPLLQQTDTEIKGYITTLQGKVSILEQSMSDVDVKIKALEYTLQTDFSQRLADIVSQLNAYKQEIQNKIDSFNSSIESLQSADTELEKKISYLDGKIDMQKDWVMATFTTLTQYNGLVADIATIRTNIETINKNITDLEIRLNEKIETNIATAITGMQEEIGQKVTEITDAYTTAIGTAKNEITTAYTSAISSAIDNCIATMKDWVNEKLANYYNIAAIDAKVQLLQTAIADGDKNLDEKLCNEITTVNKSIETAKSELTAAYENAIKTAIETNNGIIDNKIAQEIATVNNRIDTEVQTLVTHIDDIETRLFSLENSVTALLKRIQSVSFIPRYADGKVEMKRIVEEDNGFAELDFMISPKDAVVEMEQLWKEVVSVKAVYTQTRAIDFVDLPILEFSADTTNGVITVKVDGKNLDRDFYFNGKNASVALFISDGNNNMVSNYIPMMANTDTRHVTILYTTSTKELISSGTILDIFEANVAEHKYEDNKGVIIFYEKITDIPQRAFSDCTNLVSITIPESVTKIGSYAFYGCSSLTSIKIPKNVTTIGEYAFNGCSNLIDINIPNSVTSIGDATFFDCNNLTYANIPNYITEIKSKTFCNCNLTSIVIPDNVTSIGDDAFFGCNLTSIYCKPTTPPLLGMYAFSFSSLAHIRIYVPQASVDAYKWASGWSYYASQIVGYDF